MGQAVGITDGCGRSKLRDLIARFRSLDSCNRAILDEVPTGVTVAKTASMELGRLVLALVLGRSELARAGGNLGKWIVVSLARVVAGNADCLLDDPRVGMTGGDLSLFLLVFDLLEEDAEFNDDEDADACNCTFGEEVEGEAESRTKQDPKKTEYQLESSGNDLMLNGRAFTRSGDPRRGMI